MIKEVEACLEYVIPKYTNPSKLANFEGGNFQQCEFGTEGF